MESEVNTTESGDVGSEVSNSLVSVEEDLSNDQPTNGVVSVDLLNNPQSMVVKMNLTQQVDAFYNYKVNLV